jgi:hypothetical protein
LGAADEETGQNATMTYARKPTCALLSISIPAILLVGSIVLVAVVSVAEAGSDDHVLMAMVFVGVAHLVAWSSVVGCLGGMILGLFALWRDERPVMVVTGLILNCLIFVGGILLKLSIFG